MTRQIVLDTETTGLSPENGDRLIEIGCVELIDRKFTGNNLHLYVNPERVIDQEAIEVHGITNEFLADKPLFTDIAKQVLDFIEGEELVIHNAGFDIGFLNYEFGHHTQAAKISDVTDYCTVLDTLKMARKLHPGQRNSLDALCKRYSVDNRHRQLHGALLDAQILAQVYLAMTGGQKVLAFNAEDKTDQTQQAGSNDIKRINREGLNLIVQKASNEELTAHQAYMKMLQEN